MSDEMLDHMSMHSPHYVLQLLLLVTCSHNVTHFWKKKNYHLKSENNPQMNYTHYYTLYEQAFQSSPNRLGSGQKHTATVIRMN